MKDKEKKDWPVCTECQFEINHKAPFHQKDCSHNTHKHMTDPIKAKIIELVPEVMELKFGCEVERFGEPVKVIDAKVFTRTLVAANKEDESTGFASIIATDGKQIVDFTLENKSEILGSPITLAVVLRAIEKARGKKDASLFEYWTTNNCTFAIRNPDGDSSHWNLTKDNLDDQSEEFKRFLGKLLGV